MMRWMSTVIGSALLIMTSVVWPEQATLVRLQVTDGSELCVEVIPPIQIASMDEHHPMKLYQDTDGSWRFHYGDQATTIIGKAPCPEVSGSDQ
jgi:hypothetical protein